MSKSVNQKLKLLYILRILQEESDEQHLISTQSLIDKLEQYDISAERKSIYDDIAQLQDFGYDIVAVKSKKNGGYYMASREFELPELKLLVDAVQASRFITTRKSRQLIDKLEKLTSRHEASKLRRQVVVSNRIKTENESIYYVVDDLHRALQQNAQIRFQYLDWSIDKKMVPRRDGTFYQISPWALTCKDEYYYLIGYDDVSEQIKHYRVDKIGKLSVLEDTPRNGNLAFSKFDLAAYTNQTFGMFGGTEHMITLETRQDHIGIIIDRFGKDISIQKQSDDTVRVRVPVAVSQQFFGWLSGVGSLVKIVSPKPIQEQYTDYLKNILLQYR